MADQSLWIQTDSSKPTAPEVRWRIRQSDVRWAGVVTAPGESGSGRLRWNAVVEDSHGEWLVGGHTAWRVGGRGWDRPLATRRFLALPAASIGAGSVGVVRRLEGADWVLLSGLGRRPSGARTGGAVLRAGSWRVAWAAEGPVSQGGVTWIPPSGLRPALEVRMDRSSALARGALGGGRLPVGIVVEATANEFRRPTWSTSVGVRHPLGPADVRGSASLLREGPHTRTDWSGGITGQWRGSSWNVDSWPTGAVAGVDIALPGRADAGLELDLGDRLRGFSWRARGEWGRGAYGGRLTARPGRTRAGSAWITCRAQTGTIRVRADWRRAGDTRWRVGWSRTSRSGN